MADHYARFYGSGTHVVLCWGGERDVRAHINHAAERTVERVEVSASLGSITSLLLNNLQIPTLPQRLQALRLIVCTHLAEAYLNDC